MPDLCAVTSLAASTAPHHVQDRRSHVQGPSNMNTSIPEQSHMHRNADKTSALILHTCCLFLKQELMLITDGWHVFVCKV